MTTSGLVRRTEERGKAVSQTLDSQQRGRLGQFFTPAPAADLMASLPRLPAVGQLRILDPGAGVGSLTASLVARILRERPELRVHITACEVDPRLCAALDITLRDCVATAEAVGSQVETNVLCTNFIDSTGNSRGSLDDGLNSFDLIVMNPPYRKLTRTSKERAIVASLCTEVSNLYAAFLALGVHLLAPQGTLVAITPRSFANGPYFRPFRKYFLERVHLDQVHVFTARNKVFSDTAVLQENIIFSATRGRETAQGGPTTLSTSVSHEETPRRRVVPYSQIVRPDDPELFIHLSTDEADEELTSWLDRLPSTLTGLDLSVSTGRVVDFRNREHLRADPADGTVPLIHPLHMRDGTFRWPVPGARKSNAIALNERTERLLFPAGFYVVVKRVSAKEEKRRVVAALFDPGQIVCPHIAFENHVNVFHRAGRGLPRDIAHGLSLWLNSSFLDRLIRRFSGHTQINATDLKSLRYPSEEQLTRLGHICEPNIRLTQEKIDALIIRTFARPQQSGVNGVARPRPDL